MSNGSKTIKIYFPINMSESWLGGTNYYKNLFQAINMVKDRNIELFIPKNNPEIFYDYAKIFDTKKDLKYRLNKLFTKLMFRTFDKDVYWGKYADKKFDIISHSFNFSYSQPVISWIPDFQHIYLKEFFSEKEIITRNNLFANCAEKSSKIILSSNDAREDFVKFYPQYAEKSVVLNFVSYINPNIYSFTETLEREIKSKFALPDKYFYLPNQFWVHKNHITVFKAINYLKQKGVNVNLICSGYMQDYRNKDYLDNVLLKYINDNNLNDNVKFLGVIDINEVYYLMRNCISIINPSLFEGWSSTVEEAKSLGKNIILSDLDVHKEQNPPQAKYFARKDYEELSCIMAEDWQKLNSEPNYELETQARALMDSRMISFGKNYLKIINECVKH